MPLLTPGFTTAPRVKKLVNPGCNDEKRELQRTVDACVDALSLNLTPHRERDCKTVKKELQREGGSAASSLALALRQPRRLCCPRSSCICLRRRGGRRGGLGPGSSRAVAVGGGAGVRRRRRVPLPPPTTRACCAYAGARTLLLPRLPLTALDAQQSMSGHLWIHQTRGGLAKDTVPLMRSRGLKFRRHESWRASTVCPPKRKSVSCRQQIKVNI
jgi:hypothetical protein